MCGIGDGNWEQKEAPYPQKIKYPDDLPICEKCKEDGWTDNSEEIRKAIVNDPILSKHIGYEL